MPKKKVWNPRYCIACHKVIRPQEKQASYTTKNNVILYFHEQHYKQLLGRTFRGRPNLWKIEILVNEVERKRTLYMQEHNLNDQELALVGGMKQILAKMPKQIQSSILPKPTNRPPKAHVEEFEPPQDDKEFDISVIVECLTHYDSPLSSKQIAQFTDIPRSTVTWRLWEQCQGNDKSKKEELFYVVQKVKGVQYYGLIDKRIKDHQLGTISISVKKCPECRGVMTSVAPSSLVLMCPDGHTVTLKGADKSGL
jgi:hypothetical protein